MRKPPLVRLPLGLSLLLVLAGLVPSVPSPAGAQPDPRSSFPGRRVGGGTRGECSARPIVHLVPESSVFSPAQPPLLALLVGPSANPRPLLLSFRPQSGGATVERQLPAEAAALLLLPAPRLAGATVWESTYRCEAGAATAADDPLGLVSSVSPPALSLLVSDPAPADLPLRARLQQLQGRCGGQVSSAELASWFALGDLLADWPVQLPVRCSS